MAAWLAEWWGARNGRRGEMRPSASSPATEAIALIEKNLAKGPRRGPKPEEADAQEKAA